MARLWRASSADLISDLEQCAEYLLNTCHFENRTSTGKTLDKFNLNCIQIQVSGLKSDCYVSLCYEQPEKIARQYCSDLLFDYVQATAS